MLYFGGVICVTHEHVQVHRHFLLKAGSQSSALRYCVHPLGMPATPTSSVCSAHLCTQVPLITCNNPAFIRQLHVRSSFAQSVFALSGGAESFVQRFKCHHLQTMRCKQIQNGRCGKLYTLLKNYC